MLYYPDIDIKTDERKRKRNRFMIAHGKELKVFAGNSNPALAAGICQSLSKELGKAEAKHFADAAGGFLLDFPRVFDGFRRAFCPL